MRASFRAGPAVGRLVAAVAFMLFAPMAMPHAAPLSKCRLNNQSEYVSPADRTLTDEQRKDVRLRVLIDALDDVDIVFRGRLVTRRYLSDIRQTFVPLILEVYDGVEVLKGEMARTREDAKAYVLREKLCNGGCPLNTLPELDGSTDTRERVVLAMNNTLENPAEAKDRWSKKVVYSGRIDALHGPCDPFQVNAGAVLSLFAHPGEIERLKQAYPQRTAEQRRRDGAELMRKWFGIR